jgi:DNA integrity scanning protein DisA with diadenylate cyclase activity
MGADQSTQELEDFLILRDLDEPITAEELEAAGETSEQTLEELQNEGVGIRWVESEIMQNEDEQITGTFCHYQAEDEAAIREHAERAGLPATRIDRRGQPLDGE